MKEKSGKKQFEKDGTVRNRTGLAQFAVDWMAEPPIEWSLMPEAKDLCEKLVAFVEGANGRELVATGTG